MDIKQLKYFVAIAEEGSLSAASARLHVAQPSLSQHVIKIEEELGVQLLDRSPRGIVLTESGQILLKHVTELVTRLTHESAALLGLSPVPAAAIELAGGHAAPAYGLPNDAMIAAVKLMARTEGILLDPVYSGKAFAGLMAMIGQGRFKKGEKVLFVHTGGAPGLFAYRNLFGPEAR
jgi:L-cysteate sulfo-lyase